MESIITDKLEKFMKINHIEFTAENIIEFIINLSIY